MNRRTKRSSPPTGSGESAESEANLECRREYMNQDRIKSIKLSTLTTGTTMAIFQRFVTRQSCRAQQRCTTREDMAYRLRELASLLPIATRMDVGGDNGIHDSVLCLPARCVPLPTTTCSAIQRGIFESFRARVLDLEIFGRAEYHYLSNQLSPIMIC